MLFPDKISKDKVEHQVQTPNGCAQASQLKLPPSAETSFTPLQSTTHHSTHYKNNSNLETKLLCHKNLSLSEG